MDGGDKDVTPDLFDPAKGKDIRQFKLRVQLLGPPKPPSPVPEGVEEPLSPGSTHFKEPGVTPLESGAQWGGLGHAASHHWWLRSWRTVLLPVRRRCRWFTWDRRQSWRVRAYGRLGRAAWCACSSSTDPAQYFELRSALLLMLCCCHCRCFLLLLGADKSAKEHVVTSAAAEKAEIKKRLDMLEGHSKGGQAAGAQAAATAPPAGGFNIIHLLLVALLAFIIGHVANVAIPFITKRLHLGKE